MLLIELNKTPSVTGMGKLIRIDNVEHVGKVKKKNSRSELSFYRCIVRLINEIHLRFKILFITTIVT